MSIARCRAAAGLVALLAAGMVAAAPPAQAQSCTSIPGGVTGTDVTILGDRYRVPSISNIQVCTGGGSVPLVTLDTNTNSNCSSTCLSVVLEGGETDAGAVWISYQEDGSTRTQGVDPGGSGGGSDTCLLSVGSPEAPNPGCNVAIGPDELPDVNDLVPDLDPEGTACGAIPPTGEWGQHEFCEDPQKWAIDPVREIVFRVQDIIEGLP